MGSHKVKTSLWIVAISWVMVSCMITGIQAREETPSAPAEASQPQGEQGLGLTSTLKMMHTDVKTITAAGETGQTLGAVHDVIFDNTNDAVYCVVVSANNTFYPVPWQAFGMSCIEERPETTRKSGVRGGVESELQRLPRWKGPLCLRLDREQFRQAPTISEVNLDKLGEPALKQRVCTYYSQQGMLSDVRGLGAMCCRPPRQFPEPAPANLVKASSVIDMHVHDYAGKGFAEIEDLIIDPEHGSLAYATVDYGGLLTWAGQRSGAPEAVAQKTAAVPWSAINLDMSRNIALLDATDQMLDTAQIKNGDLTPLSNPRFARDIHRTFESEPYWEIFAFVPAAPGPQAWAAWRPGSEYNAKFDPAAVTMIEGTIRNVGSFRPEPDATLGLRLRVKTADGRSVIVHAGPREYARRQGMTFEPGDHVMVRGSQAQVRGESVIMASQVGTKGRLLQLRDPQGAPQWSVESMETGAR